MTVKNLQLHVISLTVYKHGQNEALRKWSQDVSIAWSLLLRLGSKWCHLIKTALVSEVFWLHFYITWGSEDILSIFMYVNSPIQLRAALVTQTCYVLLPNFISAYLATVKPETLALSQRNRLGNKRPKSKPNHRNTITHDIRDWSRMMITFRENSALSAWSWKSNRHE